MVLDRLFKKTDKDEHQYLVSLDIGTEYIKALIAEIKDDDIEIIGVGRAQQNLGDMHQGAIGPRPGRRVAERALVWEEPHMPATTPVSPRLSAGVRGRGSDAPRPPGFSGAAVGGRE